MKVNKKRVVAIVITLCVITGLLFGIYYISIVKGAAGIKPNFIEPGKFILDLADNKVYSVFKYNEDIIWFIYKSDISSEYLNIQIESQAQLASLVPRDKWFSTTYKITEDTYTQLIDAGVFYYAELPLGGITTNSILKFSMIASVVLPLLMIGIIFLIFRKSMTAGAEDTLISIASAKSQCKFCDVIGQDEVIEDLKQYIQILTTGDMLLNKHIHKPCGLLLTGQPGTGKTLIAKALAGEAGVPFFYLNSASVINRFVGVGPSNIRSCFKKARESAPCVLFIDELDAIGGTRSNSAGRNSEDDRTLLALLQELDGFANLSGVLVIGATNCPEYLDPALKRAGRFDREIHMLPPRDKATRIKLIDYYTKDLVLSSDVNKGHLAGQMQSFTGADIAYVCNEAALIAATRNTEQIVISSEDFHTAIDKFLLKGNKSKTPPNEQDRKVTAFHEAGHAVMSWLLNEHFSRITIQATTSGVGGFVMHDPVDNLMQTKEQLEHYIMICYAGRASEEIVFGKNGVTTGAANDIQQATKVILQMVLRTGFGDAGMLDCAQLADSGIDSAYMFEHIKKISDSLYKETLESLSHHYDAVTRLANTLLEREELTGDQAIAIIIGGTEH